MKFYFTSLFLLVLLTDAFSQEPSVFKAGNLEEKNPYGLTITEQYILNNQKKIKRLSSKISKLEKKLETVSNLFIDTTDKLRKDIFSIDKKLQNAETNLIGQIATLNENLIGRVEANANNTKQLRQILSQLTQLAKSINSNYVDKETLKSYITQSQLQKLQKELNKKITKISAKKVKSKAKPKVNSNKTSSSLSKMNGYSLVKKGESLMTKKKYDEALVVFQALIKKGYRPSRSNYYVGEIHFYKKRYKKALNFYKKSVSIYDKSKYMPNLLLHAGIASASIGSKNNAKKFFQTLIASFPTSKEAKRAKKLLGSL